MGPPWERNNALEGSDKRGHMAPLKKQSSTFRVAPNCHPCFLMPSSASSKSFCLGCAPRCRSTQEGASNPTSKSRSLHHSCLQVVSSCILCEGRRHRLTDLRVPQLHCVETVCPTCPISCSAQSWSAPQAQTSDRERQVGTSHPKISLRHSRNARSCSAAKSEGKSGGTTLSK